MNNFFAQSGSESHLNCFWIERFTHRRNTDIKHLPICAFHLGQVRYFVWLATTPPQPGQFFISATKPPTHPHKHCWYVAICHKTHILCTLDKNRYPQTTVASRLAACNYHLDTEGFCCRDLMSNCLFLSNIIISTFPSIQFQWSRRF